MSRVGEKSVFFVTHPTHFGVREKVAGVLPQTKRKGPQPPWYLNSSKPQRPWPSDNLRGPVVGNEKAEIPRRLVGCETLSVNVLAYFHVQHIHLPLQIVFFRVFPDNSGQAVRVFISVPASVVCKSLFNHFIALGAAYAALVAVSTDLK